MSTDELPADVPAPKRASPKIRKYRKSLCEGTAADEPILRGAQKTIPAGFVRCVVDVGAGLPLDSHDEHEVWVVTQGHGTLTQDGVAYEVARGDMVFFESGVEHHFRNDADEPFEIVSIFWS